ncbi:MAG: trypsin-like peptidase domain-containing protein, partial [Nitrososphaeraceae archaeon]
MSEKKLLLVISFLVFLVIICYGTLSFGINVASAQIPIIENSTGQDSLSLPDLFSKVQKSVVQVTEKDNSNELGSRLGSGFVYDKAGHVITNNHVVGDGSNSELQVSFLDGSVYSADLVGFDQFDDLAV